MARVRTRCKYCGAKTFEKYGLQWCSKPCAPGELDLKVYEEEHHLGDYALSEEELAALEAEKKSEEKQYGMRWF